MLSRLAKSHPTRTRVLLVDDHAAIRDGLRGLIGTEPRLEIVGEAASGEEALLRARELLPDLIVLDHEMPGLRGLDALPQLRTIAPRAQVVMFTMAVNIAERATDLGAAAVIAKEDGPVLLATLRRLAGIPIPTPTVDAAAHGVGAASPIGPAAARLRRERSRIAWHPVGIIVTVVAGYVVAFLVAEPTLGGAAATLGIVSVALAGTLLGPEAGVLTAILIQIASVALWNATGHEAGEPILRIGGGVGALLMLALGVAFGAIHLIGSGQRRADARLGAAVARTEGATPFGVVADARAIVRCSGAVLFRLDPDVTELEVVASEGVSGLPAVTPLAVRPGLARAVREATALLTDDPRDLVQGARSAAFASVVAPHGRIVGVLALFDRGGSSFDEQDRARLRALTGPAALALVSAVAVPSGAGRTSNRAPRTA